MKNPPLVITMVTRAYATAERALQINAQVQFLADAAPGNADKKNGTLAIGAKVIQYSDRVQLIVMGAQIGPNLHKQIEALLATPDAVDVLPHADTVQAMVTDLIDRLRKKGHHITGSIIAPSMEDGYLN